jgi:hypothetical protein
MYGMGNLYKRGSVWWIVYWYQGKRHRESSGSTRESDARRLLKQRIAELHSGTFVRPRDQRLIVNDLGVFCPTPHTGILRRVRQPCGAGGRQLPRSR